MLEMVYSLLPDFHIYLSILVIAIVILFVVLFLSSLPHIGELYVVVPNLTWALLSFTVFD